MGMKIIKPSKFARYVLYPLGTVVFALMFFLVLMMAKGYRADIKNGKLVFSKTGMIIVTTRPGEAKIFLNDKDTKNITTFPFMPVKINNLLPGNLKVTIKKEGYRTWENTVKIQQDYVTWVNYVLLFPTDLKIAKVDPLKNKKVIAQSENKRDLFVSETVNGVENYYLYDTSNNNLTNIWPKKTEPAETWLKVPAIVEANFSQNNDKLILKVKKDAGFDFANLDVNGTDGKITSLGAHYGQDFERIVPDPTDSGYVFAFSKNNLYRLNLNNQTIPTSLAENVIDFSPEDNHVVYYVQMQKTETVLKSVNFDGSRNETVAKAVVKNDSYKFSYSTVENVLLVLGKQDKTLSAYANINNKMSAIELGKDINDFSFSPNGRFLYFFSDNSVHHYDWEKQKEITETIEGGIKDMNWYFDENHYLITTNKQLFEIDFDNTNKVQLSETPDKFYLDQKISTLLLTTDGLNYQKFVGNF